MPDPRGESDRAAGRKQRNPHRAPVVGLHAIQVALADLIDQLSNPRPELQRLLERLQANRQRD